MADEQFAEFVGVVEPRLRRALVAAYGPDVGRDASAEALAYAFEHWKRVQAMTNAAGYLYRVGQTSGRRLLRQGRAVTFPAPQATDHEPWCEPALPVALESLTRAQRTAVVLVHGFGWQLREVAELTGVRVTTVQNHLERGLSRLRAALEVDVDA